jgi:hypothetical protein
MTLSAILIYKSVDFHALAEKMDGYSYANIVLTEQRASKHSVLSGNNNIDKALFEQTVAEGSKF